MATNPTITNMKMPFVPQTPLPVSMISTGMLYMYSCSQCDFKTHIEAMFKQHVDSVHLGITTVGNNVIINNSVATLATALPGGISAQGATLVMTSSPVATVAGSSLTGTTLAAIAQSQQTQTFQPVQPQPQSQVLEIKLKCQKCDYEAPSKNQLTLHKRKVHGKTTGTSVETASPVTHTPQYQQTIVQAQVVPQATHQAHQPQVTVSAQPQTVTVAQSPAQVQAQPQQTSQQIVSVTTIPSGTNAAGKKTYTCQQCGYSTTRRDGLTQHFESVHLKIKNHQCELCPYAASQKGTLNRHVKLRHKKKDLTQSIDQNHH